MWWGPALLGASRLGPWGPDPAAAAGHGVKGLFLMEGGKKPKPYPVKQVELELVSASWEGNEEVGRGPAGSRALGSTPEGCTAPTEPRWVLGSGRMARLVEESLQPGKSCSRELDVRWL